MRSSFLRPRELASGLIFLASMAIVGASRDAAYEKYAKLEAGDDVYALPQVDQLVVFSLGYRAAAADLLFGRTMVAAGVHFSERRVFERLDAYLWGIITLDPDYLDVYRYSDALLNLSTVEMPPENLRKARDILEFGLGRFPDQAELWLTAGQFVTYLAPQRLPATEDRNEWRKAGLTMIQRACETYLSSRQVPGPCLRATSQLSEEGETAAAIRSLERFIAIADNPATKRNAIERLEALVGQRAMRRRAASLRQIEELRRSDLPAADRLRYQLLAPPIDARRCLLKPDAGTECATSFAARSEDQEPD